MPWYLLVLLAVGVVMRQAQAETAVERGKYLVEVLAACGNCHTPIGPQGPIRELHLAGGQYIREDAFGLAITRNITPDPETGIGAWTDAEIIRAIREGKGKDGSTLGPGMPFGLYRGISDMDVSAIVAYLRTVPPVHNVVPPGQYTIPLPESYGPPVTSVPEPSRADPIAYGAYLAGPIAHCIGCHTPVGADGRRDMTRLFAGGRLLPRVGGRLLSGMQDTIYSANLTMDKETGLGTWSDAQIIQAMYGVRPDGRVLQPPMPWPYFAGKIAAEDLQALLAYLRSLQPITNKVPPPAAPKQ
jgi:mono/diheme cytochrome c family protein